MWIGTSAYGCGGGTTPADAGGSDSGPMSDGGTRDGGPRDGGGLDGGPRDGGGADGGVDGGGTDGGGLDGGPTCTGTDLCSTLGTSCSGNMLVTCVVAADGCMRETATDCTTTGMICSPTGTAACVDPCAHVPVADRCTSASRTCNAGSLEVCAMDSTGCFAITRTDCTAAAGGSCDSSGGMAVCISTADPCGGLTSCGTTMSRSCADATHLTVCDANAAGCFVSNTTACPGSTVCSTSSGTAACVDPCTLVDVCPAATYCDMNQAVACAPDAHGCLVETGRTACTGSVCSGGSCMTACPATTGHVVLDCASGTISGNTATDSTTMLPRYSCSTLGYANHEVVYEFRNATNARVTVLATRDAAATGDYDLYVLDGGDGSQACTMTSSCLGHATATGATETVSFDVRANQVAWVSYDLYTTTSSDAAFTLQVTCVVPVCGDGVIGAGETCDDTNTNNGDGCSSTCTIETGAVCYGTPSRCAPANTCGNGYTESPEACDDGNMASGDGCSSACTIEPGFVCNTATPRVCTRLCGNGTIDTGETCDDRNAMAGDGCSTACTIESGYVCEGTPSHCALAAPNGTCATATSVTATTTLTGQDSLGGGASPTGTTCGTAGGPTLYYAVTIPASTAVTVNVMPTGFDAVLKTEDACGAAACNARVDSGLSGGPETTMIANATGAPITRIVAVNSYYGGTSTNPHGGTFSISFTYVTAACGNGAIDAGETCDDTNMMSGDGCSATCSVEAGYNCRGTPSVCTMQASNATCAGAAVLSPTGSSMGDLAAGGARPTGTGCTSAAGPALWYSLTVPANSTTRVTATPMAPPTWDPVISRVTACGATGCAAYSDAGGGGTAEVMTFPNATGSAVTYLFSVGSYSATTYGQFTVSATTTMNPYTPITAACMDLSGQPLVTIATGGAADDGATAVTALPFAFSFFGVAEMGYSVTTNGFIQLYPALTGTPSTAFSNADIPTAATPNGYIAPFWDDLRYAAGGAGTGNTEQRVLVTGAPGSQVMVVEWRSALGADSSANLRFQAMLYEGTNAIELHYCSMTGAGAAATGSSATIGLENATGSAGVRVSYNTAGAATTGTGYRIP